MITCTLSVCAVRPNDCIGGLSPNFVASAFWDKQVLRLEVKRSKIKVAVVVAVSTHLSQICVEI